MPPVSGVSTAQLKSDALTLVVGAQDRAIRPAEARRVQALLPSARIVEIPRLGHLAHEEQPIEIAALILSHT